MIPSQKIKEISRLAHIYLEPQEANSLEKDLEKVFAWVETIEKVSVQDSSEDKKNASILRKDLVTDGKISGEIIKNAPHVHGPYFSVPKVIES